MSQILNIASFGLFRNRGLSSNVTSSSPNQGRSWSMYFIGVGALASTIMLINAIVIGSQVLIFAGVLTALALYVGWRSAKLLETMVSIDNLRRSTDREIGQESTHLTQIQTLQDQFDKSMKEEKATFQNHLDEEKAAHEATRQERVEALTRLSVLTEQLQAERHQYEISESALTATHAKEKAELETRISAIQQEYAQLLEVKTEFETQVCLLSEERKHLNAESLKMQANLTKMKRNEENQKALETQLGIITKQCADLHAENQELAKKVHERTQRLEAKAFHAPMAVAINPIHAAVSKPISASNASVANPQPIPHPPLSASFKPASRDPSPAPNKKP